jgi:glucose-6-phosphate 1-dehydrogenase
LFTRADEAETAWSLIDPILEAWDSQKTPLAVYESGSWGPFEADEMIARDGRSWSRWQGH